MQINLLKTKIISPGDALTSILDQYVPSLEEGNILAITSKIISLCEKSVIAKSKDLKKEDVIKQDSDAYILGPHNTYLSLRDGVLLPSAGVDESNSVGVYILLPQDVQKSAKTIWNYLRQRDSLQSLGIIITDSHSRPLRKGVTGLGLGWCGFKALRSYIEHEDLFGKLLDHTMVNVLDSLATTAVLTMGEGKESTPMALIKDAPHIVFQNRPPIPEEIDQVKVSLTEDLYGPLINSSKWIWTEKGT